MKKNRIIISLVNIVLIIIKFYILIISSLGTFLDDYIKPLTQIQKYGILSMGFVISILLDLIVNYILYKIFSKRENKIKYISLITISFTITIIEIFVVLLMA